MVCLFGAICSPVYCLNPPILLPHYCFSYSTCVSLVTLLVCLPIYSPGVCSPVLFHCYMSVVFVVFEVDVPVLLPAVLCCAVLCPGLAWPACLPVFPLGVVFVVVLFYFIIKNTYSSCTLNPRLITLQYHDRTKQPASNVSSPLYQRILQFEALSSLRQRGTDLREFSLEFRSAAEGLGYND